jgi:hypothetical protein
MAIVYTLDDDAGGRFGIGTDGVTLTVKQTLTAGSSYIVLIRATDQTTGDYVGQHFTINATAATNSGLAMTQLTAGRVYQRSTKTGGGASKGAGSIAVPITLQSAATKIEYRLRDALASGNPTLQDWTTAATSVAATTTAIPCSGIPADAKQYLLDLRANGSNSEIVLGTSAVMMGRIIAASGQSQMVRQFAKMPGYTGTNASLNVAISPYCGVYATYTDSSAANGGLSTPAWAPPADGGNYGATFAAEFLRQQVASSGVACALVGNSVGSTAIAAWAPGSANNVNLRAVLDAVGGFEAFYWHQGGDDAGAGTSKATYKSALDAMFADIAQHNAIWGANFTKLLTAMATRLSGGAGSTSSVTTIRQASKEWAAANSGIYVEPHDINLEDAVHQGQPGNIVLAQHAHRALATNDVGPNFGTPTLSADNATLYIPINLPTGATALVLTGNAKSRLSLFPTGTQANPLTISTLTYDGTNKRLVAALSAAATTNVDVYAFLHPDPSGTTANADMIRDDRTDGDGIAVGRSLEPTTAGPVTATVNAVAPPATARSAQLNFFDTTQGQSAAGNAAWNDINTSVAKSGTLVALKDPSGAATGWSGTWTTAPLYGNGFGVTGVAGIPDAVATSAVYIDNGNGQTSVTFRVSGLTPNKSHKLQTYSSRSGAGSPARTTNVAAGGGSSTVNAFGNNALVTIASAVADASGNLDIVVSQGASTQYAYLNALILLEN